jgi:tungstate transport system substrate-binding protein
MRRLIWLLVFLMVAPACSGSADRRIVVAAGTTLVDSGLIDHLADRFEASHPGIEVSVVGDASAQVLELGRRGAADVLITHAPKLEVVFAAEGLSGLSEIVFSSDFVLLAPPDEAGRLGGTVEQVLTEVASSGLSFVSRGDGSGTHEREMELWADAGIDPVGAGWYVETGQGMGLTLIVADQRGAVTLAERGAYLASAGVLSLVPIDLGADPRLVNPYRMTVVAGASPEAVAFGEWLLAEGADEIVAVNDELFGSVIYRPADG